MPRQRCNGSKDSRGRTLSRRRGLRPRVLIWPMCPTIPPICWCRRGKAGDVRKETKREQKPIRPTHLTGDALHYLFCLAGADSAALERFLPVLRAAAGSITHLGWGVDQAVGEAATISQAEADALVGDRWRPVATGGTPLRVPDAGTLADLTRRHGEFLTRLDGGFRPVPPLNCFRVVGYHSATAIPVKGATTPTRPVAAFEIHRTVAEQFRRPAGSKFRPFAAIHAHAVAGMVRHAAAEAAREMGMDEAQIDSFVLGHGSEKEGQSTSDCRLMFLPLPSITPLGVEAIRRVLVVGPAGFDLGPLSRRLNGAELVAQDSGRRGGVRDHQSGPDSAGEAVAALAFVSSGDRNFGHYLGESRVWTTVTPMVLPGHDDPDGLRRKLREREESRDVSAEYQRSVLSRLDARAVGLVRKSLREAGCVPELASSAEIEYGVVGFLPRVELAGRHGSSLKYPRFHVRLRFEVPVSGPLSVGAGRYRGLGVFVRAHA